MSVPRSEPSPGSGLIAGRYSLGDPIGRGGRAVVHEGTDPLLQRDVAIKLFHADAVDPSAVRCRRPRRRSSPG